MSLRRYSLRRRAQIDKTSIRQRLKRNTVPIVATMDQPASSSSASVGARGNRARWYVVSCKKHSLRYSVRRPSFVSLGLVRPRYTAYRMFVAKKTWIKMLGLFMQTMVKIAYKSLLVRNTDE